MAVRRVIIGLVLGAVVLLMAFAVCGGLALGLGKLGDQEFGAVLGWVAVAIAILLAIDLGCLILALAWQASEGRGE